MDNCNWLDGLVAPVKTCLKKIEEEGEPIKGLYQLLQTLDPEKTFRFDAEDEIVEEYNNGEFFFINENFEISFGDQKATIDLDKLEIQTDNKTYNEDEIYDIAGEKVGENIEDYPIGYLYHIFAQHIGKNMMFMYIPYVLEDSIDKEAITFFYEGKDYHSEEQWIRDDYEDSDTCEDSDDVFDDDSYDENDRLPETKLPEIKLTEENKVYEMTNSLGMAELYYEFKNGIDVEVVRNKDCWELKIVENVNSIEHDLFSDNFTGNDEEINKMLEKIKGLS